MDPKIRVAVKEIFERFPPDVVKEIYDVLLFSTDKRVVVTKGKPTVDNMTRLFENCTTVERGEIVSFIKAKLTAETIGIYKADPSLLDSLPVSTLRLVAQDAVREARQIIIDLVGPPEVGLVIAFERLINFGSSKEVPAQNVLNRIIESLKIVWASQAPNFEADQTPTIEASQNVTVAGGGFDGPAVIENQKKLLEHLLDLC